MSDLVAKWTASKRTLCRDREAVMFMDIKACFLPYGFVRVARQEIEGENQDLVIGGTRLVRSGLAQLTDLVCSSIGYVHL